MRSWGLAWEQARGAGGGEFSGQNVNSGRVKSIHLGTRTDMKERCTFKKAFRGNRRSEPERTHRTHILEGTTQQETWTSSPEVSHVRCRNSAVIEMDMGHQMWETKLGGLGRYQRLNVSW